MADYPDGGDSNGGAPPLSENILNLTNAEFDADLQFVDSDFSFTDPPRYFKANDPYYFEVDNIPLKQLQENCLWLRDQIAGKDLDVTGISMRKIVDLQPFTNNADRVVQVRPGKFTARVNDAYSNKNNVWESFLADSPKTVNLDHTPIYNPATLKIDDSAFSNLVGSTLVNLMYNTGLYESYQTHASYIDVAPINSSTVEGGIPINFIGLPSYLSDSLTIEGLPKIKTAVWKQIMDTSPFISSPNKPDLQQLSVDFCRRWQGIFRTSVVNVSDLLSIQIPSFDETDYLDNDTVYSPQVRLDLLFLYTHPVDAESTTVANVDGTSLETITRPRLGLVKGAGSIITAQGGAVNISGSEVEANAIGGDAWIEQAGDNSKYYNTTQDAQDADLSIQSPLSDQVGLGVQNNPFPSTPGTGFSFPSPDDLLNLAPLISQDAIENDLSLLGQTVLPLCYVIVRKDTPIVTDADIIDIRPFLRTTELTYNERSGVAGANPPLSLANPATGKAELYNIVEALRDYSNARLDILRNEIEGLIGGIPIAQPLCTLQYYVESYQNLSLLTIQQQSTQNNGDEPHSINYLAGAPPYWSDVAGGNTFENVGPGSTSVKIIPGKYLVQGVISSDDTSFQVATHILWTVRIKDGVSTIYPTEAENRLALRAYKGGDGGHRNTEQNGTASFSTMLNLGLGAIDTETATTDFGIELSRSGGNATPRFTASVTLTRIANTDGSIGSITAL